VLDVEYHVVVARVVLLDAEEVSDETRPPLWVPREIVMMGMIPLSLARVRTREFYTGRASSGRSARPTASHRIPRLYFSGA